MQIVRLTQTAPKRRKLLLVDPYPRENPYHLGPSERKAIWFPKLSLPAIAAYTPEHWDVEIQDEAVREIDLEHPADLVGISVMTCYAPRAYQLADEFRKRGVPVVLGGVHPTYCPDEALQRCDAIVTGEAEDSWPRLVADFEAGRMQRHYKMEKFPPLENYRPPRVELLSDDAYMTRMCTFTTRGCHFDCEFCSVSPFNGKSTRRRPVPEVISEITRVKQWVAGELVARMGKGSLRAALKILTKIRLSMEDGSIFAFVDDLHKRKDRPVLHAQSDLRQDLKRSPQRPLAHARHQLAGNPLFHARDLGDDLRHWPPPCALAVERRHAAELAVEVAAAGRECAHTRHVSVVAEQLDTRWLVVLQGRELLHLVMPLHAARFEVGHQPRPGVFRLARHDGIAVL